MAAGRINKGEEALDCLGPGRSEREVRKGEKCSCPEREKELFTPTIMAPRAGKDAGVRGGPDDAVGERLAHGD